MRSIPSLNPERVSELPFGAHDGTAVLTRARQSLHPTGYACVLRADIYARPDVYDMEYEGASNNDARFFARLLARVRPRRVLELACGSGRVTFTLAAALPMAEIIGVDSSIDMLGKAATARDALESSVRERVSLVEGDMRNWPGTGDAFDAVVYRLLLGVAFAHARRSASHLGDGLSRASPWRRLHSRCPRT